MTDLGGRVTDAAAAYIPHRLTAQLLTRVLHHSAGHIEAIGQVPAKHPLVTPLGAPSYMGLELGAQAAAALEGLLRIDEAKEAIPRIGHLVRVREATFSRSHLPIDTPLEVTAELDGAAPPLAIYRISVRLDGEECVTGILSTHSTEP